MRHKDAPEGWVIIWKSAYVSSSQGVEAGAYGNERTAWEDANRLQRADTLRTKFYKVVPAGSSEHLAAQK